jgi:glucose/arabinose dehydrogenase
MNRLSIHAAALATGSLVALAGAAPVQDLNVELVGQGFARPVDLQPVPGDNTRLFVCEQHTGRIEIIENGVILGTPFLDLTVSTGNEQGLLGMDFHPDYQNNGRFFVSYTNTGGNTRIEEYSVSANPNVANAAPTQTIFAINQPFSNHNGGQIQFGPDGYLYAGLGDGGSGNDPGNRAQNLTINLGKILRFDVDAAAPFIPASNPFVGVAGNDEIWTYGWRNPWRFSFDMLTGDMWVGDVGQNAREEISFQSAAHTGGDNYGWRCMEGFNCTGLSGCTCNGANLVLPVHDFGHNAGNCSVTGGFMYRGSAMPALQGTYFFADYCSSSIWSFRYDGLNMTDFQNRTAALSGQVTLITSFGQDNDGELYILEQGGQIWKIVQDCSATSYCVGAPNSFSNGAVIGSFGSFDIGDNNFNLSIAGATPNQFGFFFYGGAQTQVPGGDGFLCVASGFFGLHRLLPPDVIDGLGTSTRHVDFTTFPAGQGPGTILPGTSVYFQFWYRDPGGPGGTNYNFSDALAAVFCP